jgi:hypothetical protein
MGNETLTEEDTNHDEQIHFSRCFLCRVDDERFCSNPFGKRKLERRFSEISADKPPNLLIQNHQGSNQSAGDDKAYSFLRLHLRLDMWKRLPQYLRWLPG